MARSLSLCHTSKKTWVWISSTQNKKQNKTGCVVTRRNPSPEEETGQPESLMVSQSSWIHELHVWWETVSHSGMASSRGRHAAASSGFHTHACTLTRTRGHTTEKERGEEGKSRPHSCCLEKTEDEVTSSLKKWHFMSKREQLVRWRIVLI